MWYFPSVRHRSWGLTFGMCAKVFGFSFAPCLRQRLRCLYLFFERNKCVLGTLSIFAKRARPGGPAAVCLSAS